MSHTYRLDEQRARNKREHYDDKLLLLMLESWKPESLLDLGCGVGWYCERAREFVPAVMGVDNTPGLESIAVFPALHRDLGEPLLLPGAFDLVLCLEVAQYLSTDRIPTLVHTCTCHTKSRLVFSAAHPGQNCPGGVTFETPGQWVVRFAAAGLMMDLSETRNLRRTARLPWFKENLLVFRRSA